MVGESDCRNRRRAAGRARPRGTGHWVARLLAAGAVGWLAGCGGGEPAPPPPPAGAADAGAISPAEMRMILEGLQSQQARTQYAALETLSRFPPLVQRHRDLIERLQREGRSPEVRARAAELLASPGSPPPSGP